MCRSGGKSPPGNSSSDYGTFFLRMIYSIHRGSNVIPSGVGYCRRKQFNSPPQLENQSQCRRKTTQLVSRNETTQLSSRNEQLNSAVGTKQLNSSGENNSTLHCRRPPAPPLQQNRLFLPTNVIQF
ncbi:hypothetical protein TNCV_360121 [Trichonephila clavipes]|uniref:Uncharacterized protein n=1 Tax=Trichonephila clavipes TaxID=2585209 RepID=A0A8X6VL34_TRICX|nr:hypothetical protein TNCV_360121 [Trichonephila clavipes]